MSLIFKESCKESIPFKNSKNRPPHRYFGPDAESFIGNRSMGRSNVIIEFLFPGGAGSKESDNLFLTISANLAISGGNPTRHLAELSIFSLEDWRSKTDSRKSTFVRNRKVFFSSSIFTFNQYIWNAAITIMAAVIKPTDVVNLRLIRLQKYKLVVLDK